MFRGLKRAPFRVKSKIFETFIKENTGNGHRIRNTIREILMEPMTSKYKCTVEYYYGNLALTGDLSHNIRITYLLLYTYKIYYSRGHGNSEYVCFLALRAAPDNPSAYIRIGFGTASMYSMGDNALDSPEPNLHWAGAGFIDHVLKDWKDATIQLV